MSDYRYVVTQVSPVYKFCEAHSNRFISNCYYCSIKNELALIKEEK